MFRSPSLFPIATVVMIGLAAVPALAQQPRGSRLPSGLFGGGAGDAEQLLALGASGGGGYNRTTSPSLLAPAVGNTFGHVAGNLRYSFTRPRVGLWAGAASSAHYYADAVRQPPARHVADIGASVAVPLTGRTSLHLTQSATYQPLQTVSPFPGLITPGLGIGPTLPIDPDLATTGDGFVSYDSNAGVGYQLSRRSAVSMDAGYRRSGRTSSPGDLSITRGGARFTREMARGLGVRLGYAYSRGVYGDASQTARFDHHHIDAGFDYNRSLSLTRRTTLALSSGSTVLSDGVRHTFHVTGDARLSHDIGRSWNASLAYRRAADFVGTFRAPVAADSLAAGVNGFIGPRLRAHGTLGAAHGRIGLTQDNSFTSSYASTGVTLGVTRYLGVDVTYSFFRSDYATATLLTPGLPDQFDHQSLRASVRLWAPVLTRVRRVNAAR